MPHTTPKSPTPITDRRALKRRGKYIHVSTRLVAVKDDADSPPMMVGTIYKRPAGLPHAQKRGQRRRLAKYLGVEFTG